MERQLVSIIICNFNHGRYLRQAIDSALAQTYSPIEVIVVDDGSTDNSREIIVTYDNRIVPVLQENEGNISATNAGFSHSRGEIICFLDSDDVYLPHKVERTVAVLDSYPHVTWVRSKDSYVDQSLEPVGTVNPSGSSHLVPPNPNLYLEKVPTVSYQLPTIRRAVAAEIFPMPIPPTARSKNDAVFCALLGSLERPVYGYFLDEVLQLYRVHEAQDSGYADVVESLREAVNVGRLVSSIWSRRMGVQRTAAHVSIHALIVSTLDGHPLWGPKRWGYFTKGLGQVATLFSTSPSLASRQMFRLLAAFLAPKIWLKRWRARVGAHHLWSKTPQHSNNEGVSALEAIKYKMGNLSQEVRTRSGRHPALLWSMYWPRPSWRKLLVVRNTQMVIEGFPRSGNTFAVEAFKQAQQEDVRIASHVHLPAQVIRATRWRIPTLVLIREPADAIVSLVIREPEIALPQALKSYISFYETLIEYRNSYVLGTFEDVINDYGRLIEQVNDRFGTRFSLFENTEANIADVFDRCEETNRAHGRGLEMQVSRPSKARDELKEPLSRALAGPDHKILLARARAIYRDLSKSVGG